MLPPQESDPKPADPTLRGHSDESLPDAESERDHSDFPLYLPANSQPDATVSYLSAEKEIKAKEAGSLPRRAFGDYELLRQIGRGGMGVVYKARQIKLQRVVALKMIRAGDWASQEEVQRFYDEARAAAQLEHPGIVPIHEVGQYEGQHYFSMSFMGRGQPCDSSEKRPSAVPQSRRAQPAHR
jgi:serine/threonine protein kinase